MQGIIAEIEAGDQHMADATGGIFIGTLMSLIRAPLAWLQAICYADDGRSVCRQCATVQAEAGTS